MLNLCNQKTLSIVFCVSLLGKLSAPFTPSYCSTYSRITQPPLWKLHFSRFWGPSPRAGKAGLFMQEDAMQKLLASALESSSTMAFLKSYFVFTHSIKMVSATLLDSYTLVLKKTNLTERLLLVRANRYGKLTVWGTALSIRPLHKRQPGPPPPPLTLVWCVLHVICIC